jgi:Uma2 family endonuclease
MSEFEGNVVVPTSVPQVHEYEFPEPDYSEKSQTAEYELDASIASMQLLLGQMERRQREIGRNIDDLKDRLREVT